MEDRAREAISERNALAAAFSSGVTEDGLKLFLNLNKTIGRDVTWKGQDIIVNSIVLIKPPYKTDNCCLATESARSDKMMSYVQQLVTRFWTDAVKQSSSNNSSNRPSPEKQTSSSPTVVSGQTAATQSTAPTATTAPTAASIVAGTAKTSNGSGQQQENNSKGVTKTTSQGKKGSRNGA